MPHAIFVDTDRLRFDGDIEMDPPAGVMDDFVRLLSMAEKAFRVPGEGVVILTAESAHNYGFPVTPPPMKTKAQTHPLLQDARSAGWSVVTLRPWMTFWGDNDRALVHVCVRPWVALPDAAFLGSEDPWAVLGKFRRFAELTGSAFHGTPGVSGIGMLRGPFHPGPVYDPLWKLNVDRIRPATNTTELELHWEAPEKIESRFVHGYDQNMMYLGAAASAELAVSKLDYSDIQGFEPKRSGYWHIKGEQWNIPQLPPPYGKKDNPASMWLTTPTVELLARLTSAGLYGGFSVIESYTCRNTKRIMRKWSEGVRDAVMLARASESIELEKVLKQVYRETIGMLARSTSRAYRPDWRHTIVGLARTNLWRRMLRAAGLVDGAITGVTPLLVEVDCVWYPSNNPMAVDAAPEAFPMGRKLGEFKHKGSIAGDQFLTPGWLVQP